MRNATRTLLLMAMVLWGPSLARAQFGLMATKELEALPLDQMKLVVPRSERPGFDALLDSLLRIHWKWTPTIEFVDAAGLRAAQNNVNVLILERLLVQEKGSGTTLSTGKTYDMYTHTWGSSGGYANVVSFEWVGVERSPPGDTAWSNCVGRQYAPPSEWIKSSLYVLAITWPGPVDGSSLCEAHDMQAVGLVSVSYIDDHDLGAHSPLEPCRWELMVKGLADGIALAKAQLTGKDVEASIKAQSDSLNTRFKRARGKKLIVPLGWLSEKEASIVMKEFGDDAVPMTADQVRAVLDARDPHYVLMAMMGPVVEYVDVATQDIIYLRDLKGPLAAHVNSMHTRWKLLK